MLKIIDNGIISHQSERGAYMPVITPLADGSLIACQHVGQGLGTPDNHIEILRSTDGGITWVNEGSIHPDGIPTDGWSYRGPKISEVPDGRLVMNATRFETEGNTLFDTESEALQRPEMLLFWSEGSGQNVVSTAGRAGRPAARKVHMERGWTSPTTGVGSVDVPPRNVEAGRV